MQEYKVLITASGTGSRLGDLTKYFNKSLIRVGKKPAISYIIESYPKDTKFVVTLGYLGDLVKQFLEITYPDLSIEFVWVDKYDGFGSNLLYSINCAKDKLQTPFIYHACDTIASKINFNENCIYLSKNMNFLDEYRTYDIKENKIKEKKYNNSNCFPYIGICSILDYENFWSSVEHILTTDFELSDCSVINDMLSSGTKFKYSYVSEWYDIGNLNSLQIARETISDKFQILDKLDESIYMFDSFVIKYFYDSKICKQRVERTKSLESLVPKILSHTDNFYKYEFVDGDELSHVVDIHSFKNLLNYSYENMWSIEGPDIKEKCLTFYKAKTLKRIDQYFNRFKLEDSDYKINNVLVPKVYDLINCIDFDSLCNVKSSKFHGDFILENMIINSNKITLIDWRQDFAGDIIWGDKQYDLAKMNHNLVIDHSVIYNNLYHCDENSDVSIDIYVSNKNITLKKILDKFILEKSYNIKNIELLTGLIWLNISPLHDDKFSKFIFNMGKYKIYEVLNDIT